METLTPANSSTETNNNLSSAVWVSLLPDHTHLPDRDDNFVKNFQEHPQSIILTTSIEPVLAKLHPDGHYCIGQDSGLYWRITDPPEQGVEAPDWFYVPNVPPRLNGKLRRSYVLWQEIIAPLIAIEFVSGDGKEERDNSPPFDFIKVGDSQGSQRQKAGKFWVYEQAVRIPFYAIFDGYRGYLEVYHLVDSRYQLIPPNDRDHYAIPPLGVELGILQDAQVPPTPWLRWWDQEGNLLLTGNERAEVEHQARLQAESIAFQERLAKEQAETIARQECQQKEKLAAYLRSLGINPDEI